MRAGCQAQSIVSYIYPATRPINLSQVFQNDDPVLIPGLNVSLPHLDEELTPLLEVQDAVEGGLQKTDAPSGC